MNINSRAWQNSVCADFERLFEMKISQARLTYG